MDEKLRRKALSEFWFCLRCMQKQAVYPEMYCPVCRCPEDGEGQSADDA